MRFSLSLEQEELLRDLETRIGFAVTELDEAESHVEKVSSKRKHLESTLIQGWADFNPLDDDTLAERSQIGIEILVLDQWLSSSPPLVRAVESLHQEIWQARPLIQNSAQGRCASEYGIGQVFWAKRLPGLEMEPIANQIRNLREIAREVLESLCVLLEARRGAELTPDEVRNGIFQRGPGLGHRPLTFEELQAGVAFE